jgi:tetratricopeptide (TPR) repeat protein
MYLRYYGWEGDQELIADLIKPNIKDRNVNVEEIVYYVRTRAGWLNAQFHVGGDIRLLKSLLAAGFPVMIEESFYDEQAFWPGDDLWAAHYLLLTGYDDPSQTFIGQDSYRGADQNVPYDILNEYWKAFNRVYILVYRPEQEETLKSLLGINWDADANRQHALEIARKEVDANPQDAFAWFNIGSNLVYFERYAEASRAYDEARKIGLPQRMLRYQFGPFFAYFHASRNDDLLALTEYVLKNTPNSEEALLWNGWGLYRKGDRAGALEKFRAALKANPNYQDAQYALDFLANNP